MKRAAAANGCAVCGELDYDVLDFHHLRDKKFSLNRVTADYGEAKVKAELAKCIVLCANCHRRHHASEGSAVGLEERRQIKAMLAKLLWQLDQDDIAKLAEAVARDFLDEVDLTGRERVDRFIETHLKPVAGAAAARYAQTWIEEMRAAWS